MDSSVTPLEDDINMSEEQSDLLMDDHGGSDSSLEDLMDEYSSRPSQIAEWLWCIEYVAKYLKDLSCILEMMNIGYQYSNDYGRRINEVLALRVLEFMFDPSKNDATCVGVASTSEEKVEFDLSLSNTDVLRQILKEIPVSQLRVGMPELSKFNVLPFIAHKNLCLPQCALEKLRDVSQLETSAARPMETDDPVFRDDRLGNMNTCEEKLIDEQQVHIGLEQNINDKDKVIVIDDEDEPMHTNEKGEVILIDEDTESDEDTTVGTNAAHSMETDNPVFRDDGSGNMNTCEEELIDEQQVYTVLEPIDEQQVHIGLENEKDKVIAIDDEDEPMHTNGKGELIMINADTESEEDTTSEPIDNGNTTDDPFLPSSRRCPEDTRVKCTKDGIWLISGSDDDESDMMKDLSSIKKNPNTYLNLLPSSSQTRPENVCWKCEKEGTLLICSRSECAAKVHKECLNCPVNVDEDGNFLCPLCSYDRVAMEYLLEARGI